MLAGRQGAESAPHVGDSVVTFSQVGTQYPRVAAELAHLSGDDLDAAVRRVVDAALRTTGLQLGDDRKELERTVWALDDENWALQEKADQGEVSPIAQQRAFIRARAASAALELLEKRYGAAVYEAIQALSGNETAVLDLLGGAER